MSIDEVRQAGDLQTEVSAFRDAQVGNTAQETIARYQGLRAEYFTRRFGSVEAGEQFFAEMGEWMVRCASAEEQSKLYRPTNPYIQRLS